jgi:hypothetical protein
VGGGTVPHSRLRFRNLYSIQFKIKIKITYSDVCPKLGLSSDAPLKPMKSCGTVPLGFGQHVSGQFYVIRRLSFQPVVSL